MNKGDLFSKINSMLSTWDPIGVGDPISKTEYAQYVPKIISLMGNREALREYIIHLLIDELGLDYSSESQFQVDEVNSIVEKVMLLSDLK